MTGGTVTAREVARRALLRVERDGAFASDAIDDELSRAGLDARDRALATELAYGVLRYRSRLDRALDARSRRGLGGTKLDVKIAMRVAAYQILMLDRVPDHAAVDDAARAVSRRGKPVVGFVNAVLRALARDGEPSLPGAPGSVEQSAARWAMPEVAVSALRRAVGEDRFEEACQAFHERPPLWLRPNRLRTSADALARSLAEEADEVSVVDGMVRVHGLGSPDRTSAYQRGEYTVQDRAAQWVGRYAAPRAGQRVLDACAGLGGKTTHLAELMDGQGTLHAADQRADKLERLLGAAERLGVAGCVSSVVMDLTQGGETPGLLPHYDLVVLDAPCTGVGVMRRHPEIKWRSDAWDAASLVSIQERMLDALAPRVAVGGVMVYCVCSFLPEEGVRQIDAFLARHPEFEAEGAEPGSGIPMRHGRGDMQTWPHLDDADAFYAARLRRRA